MIVSVDLHQLGDAKISSKFPFSLSQKKIKKRYLYGKDWMKSIKQVIVEDGFFAVI